MATFGMCISRGKLTLLCEQRAERAAAAVVADRQALVDEMDRQTARLAKELKSAGLADWGKRQQLQVGGAQGLLGPSARFAMPERMPVQVYLALLLTAGRRGARAGFCQHWWWRPLRRMKMASLAGVSRRQMP